MFLYNYIIHPIEIFYKVICLMLADWLGGYGIAIIALSFLSFVLLYPFTRKAYQIQQEELYLQKILQEQIKDIKANYSGAEQFDKIQRLYDRYSYHPIMAVRSVFGLLIQLPFLLAVYYMLSSLTEIQGVTWGFIPNLGKPDALLHGINLLPFVMTLVTSVYAFVMPEISKKQRIQTVLIGLFFLVLLYSAPSALLIFWTCNLFWSLLDSVFGKKLEWLREFISDNELAFHIIFALTLTVCVFVPTEIYIKNASQLWFDYKDILKYFLADALKAYVFLFLFFIICWYKKIRGVFLSLLLGIFLGVFLQSYVIGLDYGLFDGHEIEWWEFTKDGLINTFIWFFCLSVSFIYFGHFNYNLQKLSKIVKRCLFCIIMVQCLMLLVNLKNNPIHKYFLYENGKAGILTTKNLYKVSTQNNIIVFLIDSFDASIFENIQKSDNIIVSAFKDFTYYPDATSSFGFTIYSLPEILTGTLFNPSQIKYVDYLKKAWENNPYYTILKNNHYSLNIYTRGDYVDKKAPIDNLVTEKVLVDRNVADAFGNLPKFRIVPHYLKKAFYKYDTNISNSMTIANNIIPYQIDDRNFYLNLCKGLKLNKEENCFQFYHLDGLHYPWFLNENLERLKDGEKGTEQKSALGRLKIVAEFIKQMKQFNIYDNATIVVLADHGYHNTIGSCPVFFIKKPHEHNEFLRVNLKPIAIVELMSIICQRFKGVSKILDNNNGFNMHDNYRAYYYENKNGSFTKYLITGTASEKKNWKKADTIQLFSDGDRSYKIGETIDFSYYGNSERYKGSGWTVSPDLCYSATSQYVSELILDVREGLRDHNDYIVKIRIHPMMFLWTSSRKKVSLYVNGFLLGNWLFEKDDFIEISCMIPRELLKKKLLTFRFVVDNPLKNKNDERLYNEKLGGRDYVKLVFERMQIVESN